MEWENLPSSITREDFAIVYRITNLANGRKYIGKKQLWKKITRAPLKGMKRKRIDWVPSDFLEYYGSSEELKRDVETLGKGNFQREVLAVVPCKWDAAYMELHFQILEGVIFSPDYYNGILNVRLPKRKGGIPDALQKLQNAPRIDAGISRLSW